MTPIEANLIAAALESGVKLASDWYEGRTGVAMPAIVRKEIIQYGRKQFAESIDRLAKSLDVGRPEEKAYDDR